jgi:hypothetical protein
MKLLDMWQGGTVVDYVHEFQLLIAQTGGPRPTDKDLVLMFWKGLKPTVKDTCKIDPHTCVFWTSFEDLSKHTIALEMSRGGIPRSAGGDQGSQEVFLETKAHH